MNSEKASDADVRESIRLVRLHPGPDPVLTGHIAHALDELLQRRKDGGSPEEFVERMAERLKEVAPEVQANFLHHLSTIRDSLLRIRTIESVSMKTGGWK